MNSAVAWREFASGQNRGRQSGDMSTVAIYDLHASPFIKLVDVTNHDGVISSEVLVDSKRNDPFNQTPEFLEF